MRPTVVVGFSHHTAEQKHDGNGDSSVSVNNSLVTFAKLDNLQPGETAEWTIDVKAVGSGKTKSTANLRSAAITGGVSEDEPTNDVSR
jgi:hypothetical protein